MTATRTPLHWIITSGVWIATLLMLLTVSMLLVLLMYPAEIRPLRTSTSHLPQNSGNLVPTYASDSGDTDVAPSIRGGSDTLHMDMDTMAHPSCIATSWILQHVPGWRRWRETPAPLSLNQSYWLEYAHPDQVCYKHGGHFNPGYPRRGLEPPMSSHASYLRQIILRDVYYWRGELYQLVGGSVSTTANTNNDIAAAAAATQHVEEANISFAGYFSYAGVWPQPVTQHILVKRTRTLPLITNDNRAATVIRRRRVAYYQPPTDFNSIYHSGVETVFMTFTTLFSRDQRKATRSGNADHSFLLGGDGVDVLTTRPQPLTKRVPATKGCAVEYERCLDTTWGAMYAAMTTANTDAERHQLLNDTLKPSETYATSSSPGGSNTNFVYGLHRTHAQMQSLDGSRAGHGREDDTTTSPRDVFYFSELLVGNPTHCEPLWSGDAYIAEAIAQRHTIRSRGRHRPPPPQYADHLLRSPSGSLVPPPSDDSLAIFNRSYSSCQDILRAFRDFYVYYAVPAELRPTAMAPVGTRGSNTPVHIIFTSRKGDWARQILDEDAVVHLLQHHVKQNHHPNSTVRAVKFHGSLTRQLVDQLRVHEATIVIGNHGANLLNTVFLRPNAGVVLLSLGNPGFYPFSLFPLWLHVRDVVVSQACNVRLHTSKKKPCKKMEGHLESHINDMYLNAFQRQELLDMVDAIVQAQRDEPRS